MEKEYELKYHELENYYWWFVARRNIMLKLALRHKKRARVLDIGCASGQMIGILKSNGFADVTGIDISEEAIRACKNLGMRNVSAMDAKKLDFPDSSFDLLLASDVLEHIKDDAAALTDWHRTLSRGGKLIIFVPAFQSLWSKHDDINQHHRRYSKPELLRLLQRAGFSVERVSYWNFSLFFPIYLARILRKDSGSDHLTKINTTANKLLTSLLKFENSLLSLANFPVGVSLFAVCSKK